MYLLLVLNLSRERKIPQRRNINKLWWWWWLYSRIQSEKEVFRALSKDDTLQPYKSDENFRTSNVRTDDFGYNKYVFDINCQKFFLKFSTN